MAIGKNAHGLTPNQERYCRERAFTDKTQADAYLAAGYSSKQNRRSVIEGASHLEKLDYIKKRIAELQAQVDAGALLSTQQIQAEVANIAMDPESTKAVKLKAFDQLARMQGAYSDNISVHATGSVAVSLDDKKDAIQSLLGDKE